MDDLKLTCPNCNSEFLHTPPFNNWEDVALRLQHVIDTLKSPESVHFNILHGGIARPTIEQIIHIYGEDALRAAMSVSGGEK